MEAFQRCKDLQETAKALKEAIIPGSFLEDCRFTIWENYFQLLMLQPEIYFFKQTKYMKNWNHSQMGTCGKGSDWWFLSQRKRNDFMLFSFICIFHSFRMVHKNNKFSYLFLCFATNGAMVNNVMSISIEEGVGLWFFFFYR